MYIEVLISCFQNSVINGRNTFKSFYKYHSINKSFLTIKDENALFLSLYLNGDYSNAKIYCRRSAKITVQSRFST